VAHMLIGVGRGLAYVHSQGIVHGDLKGNNVLVDDEGHPRVMDFGLSYDLGEPTLDTTSMMFCGNVRWLAPERLDPEHFGLSSSASRSTASDVYALGMLIYEVFSGKIPFFETKYNVPLVGRIKDGERPSHPGDLARPGLSDDLWIFVCKCWEGKWSDRPDAKELEVVVQRACWDLNARRPRERGFYAESAQTVLPKLSIPALEQTQLHTSSSETSQSSDEALLSAQESTLDPNGQPSQNVHGVKQEITTPSDESDSLLRIRLAETSKDYEQTYLRLQMAQSDLEWQSQKIESLKHEAGVAFYDQAKLRTRLEETKEKNSKALASLEAARIELGSKSEKIEHLSAEEASLRAKLKDSRRLRRQAEAEREELRARCHQLQALWNDVSNGEELQAGPPWEKLAIYYLNRVRALNTSVLVFSRAMCRRIPVEADIIQEAVCRALFQAATPSFLFGTDEGVGSTELEKRQHVSESILTQRRIAAANQTAKDVLRLKNILITIVTGDVGCAAGRNSICLSLTVKDAEQMDVTCRNYIALARTLMCDSTDLRLAHFDKQHVYDDRRMRCLSKTDRPGTNAAVLGTREFGLETEDGLALLKTVVHCAAE